MYLSSFQRILTNRQASSWMNHLMKRSPPSASTSSFRMYSSEHNDKDNPKLNENDQHKDESNSSKTKPLKSAPKGFEHIPSPRFTPIRDILPRGLDGILKEVIRLYKSQNQKEKSNASSSSTSFFSSNNKDQKDSNESTDNKNSWIPSGNWDYKPFAIAAAITLLLLPLVFKQASDPSVPYVTFEELLKTVPVSQISHIVIHNRTRAVVYRKPFEYDDDDAPQTFKKTNHFKTNTFKSNTFKNNNHDDNVPLSEFIPQTHTPPPLGRPIASFSVGDIDAFERHLESAEIEAGLSVYQSIPVTFSDSPSLADAVSDIAYLLLLVGFTLLGPTLGKRMIGGDPLGMKMKSKIVRQLNVKTRFSDVAGLDEAKQEIIEFVEFLKNPQRFVALGAKIPRGALLTGPPGTGKTLLARATAGEAGVPFFSIAGTDFIEVFVGVGPSRVRELFGQAKKVQPAIIFIDEIDAIGGARQNQGNDERENTLNQLLVEMDGFATESGIIVLASTNRHSILDKALLRPGRFDRTIKIDLPDLAARESMFQLHLTPLKLDVAQLDKSAYSHRLASLSPGMSGADIGNVCNEAALIAARGASESVGIQHFEAAIERVSAGPERKSKIIPRDEKVTIAHHEAGHAVAGWFLRHAHPLLKVSIVPRGESILGYARYLPKDQYLWTRSQILDDMCMTLAGRAAEQLCFGKISSGAANDLQKVTERAYLHAVKFGMSPNIGQVNFPSPGEPGAGAVRFYSDETAREIDHEVREIVSQAYERTLELLTSKLDILKNLAARLLEREVINREDLIEILGPRPFDESDRALEFYDKATSTPFISDTSSSSSSSSSTTTTTTSS